MWSYYFSKSTETVEALLYITAARWPSAHFANRALVELGHGYIFAYIILWEML